MNMKRTLVVVGAVAAVGAGGLGTAGIASAATGEPAGSNSIVDKLASKFNLDKSEVQAVFDEDRKAHETERENKQKQKLADAVTNKKITQEQADHITQVMTEIKSLRGSGDPKDAADTTREQVKAKLDELRTWARDNNVDMKYVMMGHGRGGHGGPDGMRGPKPDDTTSTQSTSSS